MTPAQASGAFVRIIPSSCPQKLKSMSGETLRKGDGLKPPKVRVRVCSPSCRKPKQTKKNPEKQIKTTPQLTVYMVKGWCLSQAVIEGGRAAKFGRGWARDVATRHGRDGMWWSGGGEGPWLADGHVSPVYCSRTSVGGPSMRWVGDKEEKFWGCAGVGCGCYCRNPSALGHRAHMGHRCWSPPGRWPWDGRVADLGALPMGMVRDEALSWDPSVLGESCSFGGDPWGWVLPHPLCGRWWRPEVSSKFGSFLERSPAATNGHRGPGGRKKAFQSCLKWRLPCLSKKDDAFQK